jgi:nitrite reductase/ring-hydroxylating ferredoxin subunit
MSDSTGQPTYGTNGNPLRKYRFSFPPYPIGWFQVAYTNDLEAGGVVPLEYFGKHLVLFRTEDGEAHVLDAYCPHLGAHLGYGGKIVGNEIRCPFHAWQFTGDGVCSHIPYSEKIPKKAVVGCWPVNECNGLIMVWHHPDGEPPSFDLPILPEYGDPEWTDYETRRWKIRSRNQEMAENAVDAAHFRYLHGTKNLPPTTIEPNGPHLHVQAETVSVAHGMEVKGAIDVNLYGFGFTTTRFLGIVETLLVNSVTAIDEEWVDVRFSFMVKKVGGKSTTEGIGRAYIAEIERQLGQDIPIWENKKHIKPPILCDGDGPIGKYRRWCKQFYADPNAIP